jgi:hypothetical protein
MASPRLMRVKEAAVSAELVFMGPPAFEKEPPMLPKTKQMHV